MNWTLWPAYWGLVVLVIRYLWSFRDYLPPEFLPQLRRISADLYFMGFSLWGVIWVNKSTKNYFYHIIGSKTEPLVLAIVAVVIGGYVILTIKRREDKIFTKIKRKRRYSTQTKKEIIGRAAFTVFIHLLGVGSFLSAAFMMSRPSPN